MSRLINVGLSQYGITEIPGDLHNPEVMKYFHDTGSEWVSEDETPWCLSGDIEVLTDVGFVRLDDEPYKSKSIAQLNTTTGTVGRLKIEKRPKWITGHLKALDLSAKMFATNQKKELAGLLTEFYKLRDEIDIWVWAPIYGLHLTITFPNDLSKEEEIRNVLDLAVNTARDQVSVLDATALKGMCVAMLGKHDEAKKYAEQIKKSIGTKVEKRYRSIYLTLAALYTETGDFKEARIFLKRAIKFNIAYLRNAQNSPLFRKFRAHCSYRSFLSEVSPK